MNRHVKKDPDEGRLDLIRNTVDNYVKREYQKKIGIFIAVVVVVGIVVAVLQ